MNIYITFTPRYMTFVMGLIYKTTFIMGLTCKLCFDLCKHFTNNSIKFCWRKNLKFITYDRHFILFSCSNNMKALRREREVLRRLMYKRYTRDERYRIYQKWGINTNSKQRRLKLLHRLWSDTKDMDHIGDSAAVVAKLIGFSDKGQALKQMFGLSFIPPCTSPRSFSWKKSMKSLL